MSPRISAFYAALGAILLIVLALRVSLYRRRTRIGLGDNGDRELLKRIRAHGNAVEWLPIGLLLLLVLELLATTPPWLHAFGLALLLGRVLHAFGLSRSGNVSAGRLWGSLLTWGAILAMAVVALWQAIAWWATA